MTYSNCGPEKRKLSFPQGQTLGESTPTIEEIGLRIATGKECITHTYTAINMRTPQSDPQLHFKTSDEPQSVRALVSSNSALNMNMLVSKVKIASIITTAHLDTCATHCFLSEHMSFKLATKGHPSVVSKTSYSVEQGNPLCVTRKVHILPLMMCHPKGGEASWDAALFIVADCGAEVIIGYPILRLGEIINYDPPEGYELALQANYENYPSPMKLHELEHQILHEGRAYEYKIPDEVRGLSATNTTEFLYKTLTVTNCYWLRRQ